MPVDDAVARLVGEPGKEASTSGPCRYRRTCGATYRCRASCPLPYEGPGHAHLELGRCGLGT